MNRAERRKNKIRNPAPVYDREAARRRQEMQENAAVEAASLLWSVPIMTLYHFYGWRANKRLPDFAMNMQKEYEAFANSAMTLEEYAQKCYEITGIMFEAK